MKERIEMQDQVNEITIEGNLTRDPEIRHFPDKETGEAIPAASLRVANNVLVGREEQVNYLPVEVVGAQAAFCEQYLRKGSRVIVTGQLRQDRWEDDGGEKHSKLYVKARKVRGRDRREGGAEPEAVAVGGEGDPDDIPF
jgi:single-strand DNA-binding protein